MKFEFIENEERYWEFIRLLRTNPRVVQGFVEQNPITPEQQKEYMTKHGKFYYICLVEGKPVGFIGVILGQIRIATLPEYQRRGVGTFMVKEVLKRYPDAVAPVKIDNKVSQEFFTKLGFELSFHILTPPGYSYFYENPLRL